MTTRQPHWLWADEHPSALRTTIDPTIEVAPSARWDLPAGWSGVVNDLHADLLDLLPRGYTVTQADQKMARLRYYTVERDATPEQRAAVTVLTGIAAERTKQLCEVCGQLAPLGVQAVRCGDHPLFGPSRVPHARAVPPPRRPAAPLRVGDILELDEPERLGRILQVERVDDRVVLHLNETLRGRHMDNPASIIRAGEVVEVVGHWSPATRD